MMLKTKHSICFVFSILFTISSIGSSYIEWMRILAYYITYFLQTFSTISQI
jgi:hypothetical protein